MASTVYTVEEIELQDDTTVTLRPLNIKGLRKFMAKMEDFKDVETNDEGMDVLLDAAAICLMKERPEFWDKDKDNGTKKNKDGEEVSKPKGGHTEEFEDAADMPTVYRIIEICGGIKLDDPNLLAAAAEVLGTT